MRIMVRTLRGDRVALDVEGATPVAQVKSMVMGRERIPVAMQRLFFAGRHLDDDGRTLAHYGVQHDSVVFLSLRLHADAPATQETHNLQMQPEPVTVKQELHHEQQMHVRDHDQHEAVNDEGDQKVKRKPVSRRSLRKILSRLHVDAWTSQHDTKFLDLLLRHTRGGERNVGDLTGENWSAICAELNAAMGSGFPVEELQRRLGEFQREFEAMSRIKNHPRFSYDPRRRVVVAQEADWKRYILEHPEAVTYEGRSPHFGRLRAIFSGDSGGGTRGCGGAKCRESPAKRYLNKLLRNFGLRCKL